MNVFFFIMDREGGQLEQEMAPQPQRLQVLMLPLHHRLARKRMETCDQDRRGPSEVQRASHLPGGDL